MLGGVKQSSELLGSSICVNMENKEAVLGDEVDLGIHSSIHEQVESAELVVLDSRKE